MTYEEQHAITQEAEHLFYNCAHQDPDRFCDEDCPHAELCNSEELHWGCGVWEEAMGEDL